MRRLLTVVTIAAMLVAFGAVTSAAKPPATDRSSSTSYTVAADWWSDEGMEWSSSHVEAYQTGQGAFIGFLEWNRFRACDNGTEDPGDDGYLNIMFDSYWDQSLPADTFTVGNRYSSAYVVGSVRGQIEVQNDCGDGAWFDDVVLDVTIDLTANDTTIRERNSSWFHSPEFRESTSFSFTGRGANGTVTVEGDPYLQESPSVHSGVDGRIGLSRYSSVQSSS